MKKSVYSLVLMDDVVAAIDHLAYQNNTSRSNLINQILAEHVSLVTPEAQMRNIFATMENLLKSYQHFQIQPQAADSMLSIRSVLRYKYNPTIRYAITLSRRQHEQIGELKVISRTQSSDLQNYLNAFFKFWTQLEKESGLIGWKLDTTGKWSRILRCPPHKSYSLDEIATGMTDYVKWLDEGLRIYCTYLHDLAYGERQVAHHFLKTIQTKTLIIL
jgi:hypothetical protein